MIRRTTLALSILALATAAFADGVPRITTLTPSRGSIYGGDLVTITYENFSIDCPVCSPPFAAGVFFGGVASTDVRPFGDGRTIVAVTPPRSSIGPVDVAVTNYQNAAVTAPGAFTYTANLDPSTLETILIPLPLVPASAPLPGANGSQWASELFVRNGGSAQAVTFLPDAYCPLCDPPLPVGVLQPNQLSELHGDPSLPGHILLVQRSEVDFYAYSLRVRDLSRSSQNEGTEIPVVREAELSNRPIELLNVPLNATSRAALRLFETHVPSFFTPVAYVTITSMTNPADAAFVRVELTRDRSDLVGVLAVPGYATINDLRVATGLPEGRYRVEVIPQTYSGWAFVAVTNNETQLVTAITPK